MTSVSWLHISDLHFRQTSDYNQRLVLEKLVEDVYKRKNIAEDLQSIDFIVFSGDLAWSGHPLEYEYAWTQFFLPLLQAAGLESTSNSPLFIVPGNHDIDRREIGVVLKAARQILRDRDNVTKVLEDEVERQYFFRRLRSYVDFFSLRFPNLNLMQPGLFHTSYTRSTSGLLVGLVGLNSCWLAEGGENDLSALAIGEIQVDSALRQVKDADLKIAVMHHPFEWLNPGDREQVQALLTATCDVVLHGHLHRQDLMQENSLQGSCLVIPGGALYQGRAFPNVVNYVHFDSLTNRARVYFRAWNDRHRTWGSAGSLTRDGKSHWDVFLTTPKKELEPTDTPALSGSRIVHIGVIPLDRLAELLDALNARPKLPVEMRSIKYRCKVSGTTLLRDAEITWLVEGKNAGEVLMADIPWSIAGETIVPFRQLGCRVSHLLPTLESSVELEPALQGGDGKVKNLLLPFCAPGIKPGGDFRFKLHYVWPHTANFVNDYWMFDFSRWRRPPNKLMAKFVFDGILQQGFLYRIDARSNQVHAMGALSPIDAGSDFECLIENPGLDDIYVVVFEQKTSLE